MLLPTMNAAEVYKEVKRDIDKLFDTTVQRLGVEYERERKKFKIDKQRTYTKIYTIKTATKNNWLLYFKKNPGKEVFNTRDDAQVSFVTWFYDKKGLRVILWTESHFLQVFNGHFFSRYNERMKLNLSQPVDIIRHFFKYNYSMITDTNGFTEEGFAFVQYFRDGLALGSIDLAQMWMVHKTFVSRDLFFNTQNGVEGGLMDKLEASIFKAMATKKLDEIKIRENIDHIKVLSGKHMD